jgi:uncharacterized protein (TIGR04255 family)
MVFMTKINKNDLPSFRCPPVVEVVVGIQFAEPLEIRTLDVADIWEELGKKEYKDYKELRRLDPIMPPNVMHFEISDAPDFPRYLFRNNDGSALIQFQKDRFIYNWTKPDDAPADCYPRYDNIIKEFVSQYKKVIKTLKSKSRALPKPAVMELTYVNLIEYKEADVGDISKVFKDISWKDGNRFLPAPTRMNLAYGFKIEEINAMMTATMGLVQLVKDGQTMLKLELSVKGPLGNNADTSMMSWCTTAREWIVKGFTDLTTPEMHKKWEKQI